MVIASSDHCIRWMLHNFSFVMFIVAALFILLHRMFKRDIPEAEIVYRWVALFALGFTGIYTFIMHVYYPAHAAAVIGWQVSPFQYEVGIADLAIGVLGVLSFHATYGFRLATVVSSTILLWGCAVGHIYQMVMFHNYTNGNAGSWFNMDLIVPMILIVCILRLRRQH